jgi:hypothetical protein
MKPIDLTTPLGALRLVENDIAKNFPGGRVVLVADNGEFAKTPTNPDGDQLSEDMKIMGITVIINYRKNEAMADWPQSAEEISDARFTLNLKQVPAAASTAKVAKK